MLPELSLAIFVVAATAVDRSEFSVNELLKRQEGSSGAQYQCHADCGYTILDASADNCDNSTWTDLLSNCEGCANTYDILQHYGDQVESAAEDCGLDVTFSPSAGASITSAPAETSSVVASSGAGTTSTPSSASATAAVHATSASGTIVPSPASNTSTLAPSPATPSETAVEESTGAGATIGSPCSAAIFGALGLTLMVIQAIQ